MASAQVDAAPAEEVINAQDKINSAEETFVDEQTLPKSIEESEVVVHEEEDDEEHELEGEVKNFEDEEDMDNQVIIGSPKFGEFEPSSTLDDEDDNDDDDDAEEGKENKI